MCVQNDMLTIAGEVRLQNGTHPNGSRKPSPVRNCSVSGSSRHVAGCADSQNFRCARHVRNLLPYRLTYRFVVILRLPNREPAARSSAHLTAGRRPVQNGLYACTGAADRARLTVFRTGKDASARCPVQHNRAIAAGRARIVQRTNGVRSRKFSPHACRTAVDSLPTNARHRRNPPFRPPENAHLDERSDAPADIATSPEKPHRNLPGFKNPNRIRYLRTVVGCCCAPRPSPENPHLSTAVCPPKPL